MIFDDLYKMYEQDRVLIFDLDNTLYDEDKYLFGAYKKIANSQQSYSDISIYKFLSDEYRKNGRFNLLDKLDKKFPELDLSLNEMLDLMRTYDGAYIELNLKKWFLDFLNVVNSDFVIRIITNGNIIQQTNKVDLLNINNLGFETDIVYASMYGGKPNIESYSVLVGSKEFCSPVYIGDSKVDELFAVKLGIDFYHA